QQSIGKRALDLLSHHGPADIDQLAVFHARRAGGFTVAAREAAVEVQLRGFADRPALEHFLYEVNAPARAVELVAQFLIRGARGLAEAAMHATAQDLVGGFALGRIAYPGCKIRLHESELAEKAAGVEHAGGVEFLLEALADYAHCSRDRVKHRHLGRAFITVQHGVASV